MAFDLHQHPREIQDRLEKGICELTGAAFNFDERGGCRTPSIDRIDSKKGYTYDNIRFIVFTANLSLRDWQEGEVFEVMRAWVRKVEALEALGGRPQTRASAVLVAESVE